MLKNKSVYIIPGVPGNRMIHVLDSPKILAEIPITTPIEEWERFFIVTLRDSKRFGHLPKKQRLKLAGFNFSEQWFQCFNFASMIAVK